SCLTLEFPRCIRDLLDLRADPLTAYRSASSSALAFSVDGGGGGLEALVSALKLGRFLGEQPALKLSASNLYETRPVSPGTATSSCSSWSPFRLGVQYEK